MSTQELHIALDILLQKINSNSNKDFLPQEKDYFINREIYKFIRQRTNPLSNDKRQSIFDTLQRVQNLKSLLKTETIFVINQTEKEAVIQLPFDFLGYIGTIPTVYPVCEGETIPTALITSYYASFKPIKVIAGLTGVLVSITIGGNTTTLFNLGAIPTNYLPQDNIEDYKKAFIYNNAMITLIRQNLPSNIQFRFNNITQLFEFYSTTPYTISYSVNTISQTVTATSSTTTRYTVNSTLEASTDIKDEEWASYLNRSNLSNSTPDHLIGFLRGQEIRLKKPNSVILTKVDLTYLRKPVTIDLLLDSNSDLPNEVLDEVISNTAESMKATISSDTYEKFAKDNLLIE